MEDLRVAIIQTGLKWEDKAHNLGRFDEHFGRIREQVDLVVLPEMFNTGFSINPEACAETMDGPGAAYLVKQAKAMNAVVMGSLLVKTAEGSVNRLIAAHPDGRQEIYDKRHLFRLSEEFRIINGGAQRLVVDVKGWKVRPLVCYDLRFPVWSKNTYNDGRYEYDVLVYIANWPASRSHVWKTLLAARAMENQVYCIGVNRIGEDGHGTYHSGDSMILGAKGNILESIPAGEEGVKIASLSRKDLELFRDSFTVGMDWDRFSIEI